MRTRTKPLLQRRQIYLVYRARPHEAISEIARHFSFQEPLAIYRHPKNWRFRALNRNPNDFRRGGKLYIPMRKEQSLPLHLHSAHDVAPGNRVRHLIDGPEIFKAMVAAIRKAKRNINLEFYIFKSDGTGRMVADLLIQKAKEGVEVNVLLDEFGSMGLEPLDQKMRDAGVDLEYAVTMNESFTYYLRRFFQSDVVSRRTKWEARGLDNRDHRKLLIIDGKVAFLGGVNIGDEYSWAQGPGWHDVALEVRGPIVGALQSHFFERWMTERGSIEGMDIQAYFPRHGHIPGGIRAGLVTTVPGVRRDVLKALLKAIRGAKRYIYIEVAYLTSARILALLKKARRRGVEVVVIVSMENQDVPIIEAAMELAFYRLQRKGIKVLEYPERMCHTKAVIIDDEWAMVGSANLDNRSFRRDYELNLVFWDRMAVLALKHDLFKHDIAISKRLRKPDDMFRAWVRSWIFLKLYRFL